MRFWTQASLVFLFPWWLETSPAAADSFEKIPPAKELVGRNTEYKGHDERLEIATPGQLSVRPGFEAEVLYEVPIDREGTWVSLTVGPKGRLIASAQHGPLYRITPPPLGSPASQTKVERLDVRIGYAQGLLYAFDSLYVVVNGKGIDGRSTGLYRVVDSDGDDQFDRITKLFSFPDGTSHGVHAVVPGPDGKSLYVVAGNRGGRLPDGITSTRVPEVWAEDHLLPRQWPPDGFDHGIMAPGGWICKTDADGTTLELISIGSRNPYDIAFNADGELFYYDADMERDKGTPWFRPTRICHVVSGSEYGWRGGSGKWPTYYPDSLPPVVDIGFGSPTGMNFGYNAKFPDKYRKALYAFDWAYGIIYAVHLVPDGASYSATVEKFVVGKALPLTDAVIHPFDGAMYFTIGGRGTQSALYRLRYVGPESTVALGPQSYPGAAEARALRSRLEAFHGRKDPAGIEFAWPYLGHADRFIRYAACIASESQEATQWQERALSEKDPHTLITALVALARHGDGSLQSRILEALERLDFVSLTETQQVELLRAYALTFIRMGRPDSQTLRRVAAHLDAYYPAAGELANRELSRVLVYLESPSVITKTLALMATARTQEQQFHYAWVLRKLRYHWTIEQRKQYFQWFDTAMSYKGGVNYHGYVRNMKRDALANTSKTERTQLADLLASSATRDEPQVLPTPKGPGKHWQLDELLPLVRDGLRGRDYKNGRKMYAAAHCASCHNLDDQGPIGGAGGPVLNGLARRFTYTYLLESILEPDKVVSDQYQNSIIMTADGSIVVGRVVDERDGKQLVMISPLVSSDLAEVSTEDIRSVRPSKVSPMMAGLLDSLNQNEVLDLLAYLMSGGNEYSGEFR